MDTLTPNEPKQRHRRLTRQEREGRILEGAIRFFAEFGFEGQTRGLADRLGITQPLLYRYFPDKDSLIDRVFREIFERDWNPDWDGVLADSSRSLAARLDDFYRGYLGGDFGYERARLFFFASLKDDTTATRWLTTLNARLFQPILRSLRSPTRTTSPEDDLDLIVGLHSALAALTIRRHRRAADNTGITALIGAFIEGADPRG